MDPFFTTQPQARYRLDYRRGVASCQHDGFVTLLTSPGKSPTDNVHSLFAGAKGEKKSGPSVHPFESQQGNGELILVVDDEKPVRAHQQILTRFGTMYDGGKRVERL